jgi:hypothetical protein
MEEAVRHHIGNHTPTIKTVEFNHTRGSASALKFIASLTATTRHR